MTVIDLMIQLQKHDPNKEVMLDHTTEGSTMFKFVETNFVSECTTAIGDEIILITPFDYEEETE